MADCQGSPPKQQPEPQSPTRMRTQSSSVSLFSHIELPLLTTPVATATTSTASTTSVSAAPRVAGHKRSAEDYEDAKRPRNETVYALPKAFSFPALPPTSHHALPGTFLPPNSVTFTPTKILPGPSVTSTLQQSTTIDFSISNVAEGVTRGRKGSSPRPTTRGRRGGGDGRGRFGFDMTDVMGYVDSDLIDEASSLFKLGSRAGSRRDTSDGGGEYGFESSTTTQNFMNEDLLAAVVGRIAHRHQLLTIDSEVISYLALATKERLHIMTERMVLASQHRRRSLETLSSPPKYDADHPMFRIRISQDVKKQLLAIERVEREEELSHKEHFAELYQQRLIEQAQVKGILLKDGDEIGKGGKKETIRFRFGSISNARVKEPKVELTEDEKLGLTNQTALQFAGSRGRRSAYAWMTPSGRMLKRPMALAETETDTTLDDVVYPLPPSSESVQSYRSLGRFIAGPCNKNTPLVSVKDALFCLERECGGEGTGLKVLIKNYAK